MTGVSGGADSVCLLLLLSELQKEIPFTLLAAHVNHLIRPEAGQDAAFVRELCGKRGVPFFLIERDVTAIACKLGISTEEAGRQVRYAAFEEILSEYAAGEQFSAEDEQAAGERLSAEGGYAAGGCFPAEGEQAAGGQSVAGGQAAGEQSSLGRTRIAVAHNLNDRAETMLFNLFRGAGLTGLAGIRPVRRRVGKPDIIRPLLSVTRAEIEDYLTSMGAEWCIDSTNGEDTYTRNRIRHHILPYAEKEIAGGAINNMGRAADILAETEDYVHRETEKVYRECLVRGGKSAGRQEDMPDCPDCAARGGRPAGDTAAPDEDRVRVLSAERLLLFHPLLQKQVILRCLEELTPARKDITRVHVEDVLALFSRSGNREIHLPYGIKAVRSYDKVILEKSADLGPGAVNPAGGHSGAVNPAGGHSGAVIPAGGHSGAVNPAGVHSGAVNPAGSVRPGSPVFCLRVELPKPGGEAVRVPLPDGSVLHFTAFKSEKSMNIPQNQYTKWFDYDKIDKSLEIRTRQTGDYITFNALFSRKTVQNYMVEEKIPAGERDRIYLLAQEHHVLWITGYRISSFFKLDENTRHILQVTLER